MGGSDDPSNLIELSIEDHAEAHRLLWEKHGHWQDKVAWQGLAKLISKKELLHEIFVQAGKKSRPPTGHKANLGKKWSEEHKDKIRKKITGMKRSDEIKKKLSVSKSRNWIVTDPKGNTFQVFNLHKFCFENNLDSTKMSIVASGVRKHHKGYTCQKVL
jgi:hypothetical protein